MRGRPSQPDRSARPPNHGALGERLDPAPDATAAFAALSLIRFADRDIAELLPRLAELAQQAVPPACAATVRLLAEAAVIAAGHGGDLLRTLDEHYDLAGWGVDPPVPAAGSTIVIVDLTTEQRWPEFTAAARHAGVRSMLATALPVAERLTATLTLYAYQPGAFDKRATELAGLFASSAAATIANATRYARALALADQMSAAMASRAAIEQAKDILMERFKITADDAFLMLSQLSQSTNRKVRELADELVRTGSLPTRHHSAGSRGRG